MLDDMRDDAVVRGEGQDELMVASEDVTSDVDAGGFG